MASIGTVALSLGLIDKEFKTGLDKAETLVTKTLKNMQTIALASKLGSYFFAGAEQYSQKLLNTVNAKLNALAEGLSSEQFEMLSDVAKKFKQIGISADTATQNLVEFVLQGSSSKLKNLGIYLNDYNKSLIDSLDLQERFNWILENSEERIALVRDEIGENNLSLIAMQNSAADVKEALGASFLGVLNGIIQAFGGVKQAMQIFLAAFAIYKIATIIGNVAIGISKAIAQGGVFVAPIAIGLGFAALASIGAIIGASIAAGNAINNIEDPASTNSSSANESGANVVVIQNSTDRWGQTQKVISERSGGQSSNVQTNYGN